MIMVPSLLYESPAFVKISPTLAAELILNHLKKSFELFYDLVHME